MQTISTADWRSTIITRLDKLERQNRRLKVVGTVMAILAVLTLALGQVLAQDTRRIDIISEGVKAEGPPRPPPGAPPVPRTLKAQEFILEDAKGNRRAWLGLQYGKFVVLDLYDQEGTNTVQLRSHGLRFHSKSKKTGRSQIELSLDAADTAGFSVYHEGRPVGSLHASVGGVSLSLNDPSGKGSASLSAMTAGIQQLALGNPESLLKMSTGPWPTEFLIGDPLRKPRAYLHIYPEGVPRFELVDENGNVASISERAPE